MALSIGKCTLVSTLVLAACSQASSPPPAARTAAAATLASSGSPPQTKKERIVAAGRILADFGGKSMPIAGAKVVLFRREQARLPEMVEARSLPSGNWKITPIEKGTWEVCAEAPGLRHACSKTLLVLSTTATEATVDLHLQPIGTAIRGRITFAGGERCSYASPITSAKVSAHVRMRNRDRRFDFDELEANDGGEFIIGDLCSSKGRVCSCGAGAYRIQASCGASKVVQDVTVGVDELAGATAVEVVAPNHLPQIESVTASDANGAPLRRATPGQVVTVTAAASDADNDDLRFTWIDGQSGEELSDHGPSVQWTMPAVEGHYDLHVEVSDGKGGFANERLALSTSQTGVRLIGSAAAPNATGAAVPPPISNAQVTFDGQPATFDDEGNFRAAVGEADRHVINFAAPGYPLLSRISADTATGIAFQPRPTTVRAIDPTSDNELGESDLLLDLPEGGLGTSKGAPPTGMVTVETYRYAQGTGELPGDGSGSDANGNEIHYQPLDALYTSFTDDVGQPIDLLPGATAQISFPIPASITDPTAAPAALPLASYDLASGMWRIEGTATLSGDHYLAQVSHFSVWSFGPASEDHSCIKIVLDQNSVPRPIDVTLFIPAKLHGEFDEFKDYTLHDTINMINHVPSFTKVNVLVRPGRAQNLQTQSPPLYNYTVQTGLPSPDHPPYPYLGCSVVKISEQIPNKTQFLDIFENTAAQARDYVNPEAQDLASFKQRTRYPGTQNEVVFFDPNELGLGRRTNCWSDLGGGSADVICIVTKFGEVGSSPAEMFDDTIHNTNAGDTVGIWASPNAPLMYYAWGPDGKPKISTEFDNTGPKYLPSVCMHCHGLDNEVGPPRYGETNPLDPFSYRYPGVSSHSPHSLDAQQESFRANNALIATLHSGEPLYIDLLDRMYPDDVGRPGVKAIDEPPPLTWGSNPSYYNTVIRANCRFCHLWQTDNLNWDAQYPPNTPQNDTDFEAEACAGNMPNAMNPELNIWRDASPPIAQILGCLNAQPYADHGFYDPKGVPPTITIDVPSQSAYGFPNIVQMTAHPKDHEDGPDCCFVEWVSNVDGDLGQGKVLQTIFGSPGARTINAYTYDSDGNLAQASAEISITNLPPTAFIDAPISGSNVLQNTPVTLLGHGTDPDEQVACSQLTWTVPGNPSPEHACQIEVTFSTPGVQLIDLQVTDQRGVKSPKAQIALVVQAPTRTEPPVATITKPTAGTGVPWKSATLLKGTITDPADSGQVKTAVWSVVDRGTEHTLFTDTSAAASFTSSHEWTPVDELGFSCGPRNLTLKLTVTDSNGTTHDEEPIVLALGPC